MSDQDAFERILASLHDAMLDDAYWPDTSALIDDACGMQGSALGIGEGLKGDVQSISSAGLYYRGERREDLEREYLEIYRSIDETLSRFWQLPDSDVVHVPDLYTAEELKTSSTYNEFLSRARGQDGLNVRLAEPNGSHIAWIIADPVAPGGWETSQLAMIKGLLPHIRQFVRVRQALISAQAWGASVTDLLGNPRIGVIHLDRYGRIVEANDRARAILRRGDGVSDRDGELRAYDPATHARLERLVAGALPTSGTVAVSESMLIHRSSVALPFVVHVKPVVAPRMDFGARRVAALVLIAEPKYRARIDPSLVAEALGLTLRESQVAVWLAEGKTVHEIAVATGRQESSIHWHLKQIYHKQGLSRQADLVRLVLSIAEFA